MEHHVVYCFKGISLDWAGQKGSGWNVRFPHHYSPLPTFSQVLLSATPRNVGALDLEKDNSRLSLLTTFFLFITQLKGYTIFSGQCVTLRNSQPLESEKKFKMWKWVNIDRGWDTFYHLRIASEQLEKPNPCRMNGLHLLFIHSCNHATKESIYGTFTTRLPGKAKMQKIWSCSQWPHSLIGHIKKIQFHKMSQVLDRIWGGSGEGAEGGRW